MILRLRTKWLFETLSEAVFQWFISPGNLSPYMRDQTGLAYLSLFKLIILFKLIEAYLL